MAAKGNIFMRDDTFFGVCEAIGEDFGFNANWLRVALAGLLYWFPLGVVTAYAGMAVVVLASRLIAPDPRRPEAEVAEPRPAVKAAPAAAPQPARAEELEQLPVAA